MGEISRYDASPEAALQAVRAGDGPLLVDLDETLYLRNSTEDFIDCARPALVALLILRVLDIVKPWRFTGRDTRDNWRVGAISILFWRTYSRWRTQVQRLAADSTNEPLKQALKARPEKPIILTTGFTPIVTPLVTEMGFDGAQIIASRIFPFADRRDGKLSMASRELGEKIIERSTAITDSLADLPLLERCGHPFRTVWPQARYRRAFTDVYLPGQYISLVKHPGKRFISRSILQQDFAFWVLATIGLAVAPIFHVLGLFLLLISFWAIYERGYVDNDIAAALYEDDPALTSTFRKVEVATPPGGPWIWAICLGAAGTLILHPHVVSFCTRFALWIGILIATRACYSLYNSIDKMSRIWVYPVLQLARVGACAVMVPVEPAGAAALGASVLARWMPYQYYRLASAKWANNRMELVRLISFMIFTVLIAAAAGVAAIATWGALAMLLWNIFRARKDIFEAFKSARRIDRPTNSAPIEVSGSRSPTHKL